MLGTYSRDMTLDPGLLAATARRSEPPQHPDHLRALTQQTETAMHLMAGNYNGVATVAEAYENAWLGLGVVDHLDGEVAVVDGVVWVIPDSGVPYVADPSQTVPFAMAETKAPAASIHQPEVPPGTNLTTLAQLIDAPSHETVTIRLEGFFSDVLLRSEHRQEPPYQRLDQILNLESDQEVRFHFDTWRGVLVGYRFPESRDGILLPGAHVHGVSSDHRTGGHCRAFTAVDVQLTWAPTDVSVTLSDSGLQELLNAAIEHHDDIRAGMSAGNSPTDIARRLGIVE